MTIPFLILLAVVVGVFIAITEGRHKRTRRRLSRLERANAEMLMLVKPLCSQEAERQVRAAGKQPRRVIEFRSQFGEDVLLWHLFSGKTDGFYIECGAY